MIKKLILKALGYTDNNVDNNKPITCEHCGKEGKIHLPDQMEINKKFLEICSNCRKSTYFLARDFSTTFTVTQNTRYQIYQYKLDGKEECIRIIIGTDLSPLGRFL
jgi:hypothetical protein